MENKYDKYFWDFEGKNKEKGKRINSFLNDYFNDKISSHEIFKKDYLDSICLNYHMYESKLKEWIQKEILSNFTKETLIYCYLIKLMDVIMLKEDNKINLIMTSFKAIGLIKDIYLKDDNIILVTNSNDIIKIKKLFSDIEIRDTFRGKCHSACEFLIRNHEKLKLNSYIITIEDKYAGKFSIYHSILLKGKYIIDPARNIVMKLEDYKNLFNPKVIMCMDRETMLKEIDRLQVVDFEFNKSKLNNVLKLAINTQMRHK